MQNSIKSDNDVAAYVKSLTEYYLEVFKKIKDRDFGISWNWCGFFFSLGWMIYRRMYISAITIYACCIAMGILGYFFMESLNLHYHISFHLYNIIILLTCSVAIGCFGNRWYKKHIDDLIEEGKHFCAAKKRHHIERTGGTYLPPVVIFVIINVIIFYLGILG